MRMHTQSLSSVALLLSLLFGLSARGATDYMLIDIHPRNATAFTQGLEFYRGRLYESSGLYEQSFIHYGDVDKSHRHRKLPERLFAEGLTILDDRLYVLTWRAGKCLVFDPQSLERTGELNYDGEGWGLTNNGRDLIKSDGSDTLAFLEPDSGSVVRRLKVHHKGRPIDKLNELEWHDGLILANRWRNDYLLVIDEKTGQVLSVIDLSHLYPRFLRTRDADVMNGIAYDPGTDTWLITGKFWPAYYRLRLQLPTPSP